MDREPLSPVDDTSGGENGVVGSPPLYPGDGRPSGGTLQSGSLELRHHHAEQSGQHPDPILTDYSPPGGVVVYNWRLEDSEEE